MKKILFVCLGNICRSPTAKGLFKHYISKKGLEHQFLIESRATSRYEIGNMPHPGTRKVLEDYQVDYQNMRAKQIQKQDMETFDVIIGMDKSNVEDLKYMFEPKYHHKIIQFIPNVSVPGPYYTHNFKETHDLIMGRFDGLLEELLQEK